MENVERAILARLRQMDEEDFAALPDSGAAEGLPGEAVELWTVKIPGDVVARWRLKGSSEVRETHTLRYQAPEGQTEGVSIYVKQGGEWRQADTELMGIYHLFDVDTAEDADIQIAVCIHEKGLGDYLVYIIPAAVVVLVILILVIWKKRKKRKAERKEAETA